VEALLNAAWTTIVVLALVTIAIKGAGPALVGGRDLPMPVMRVIALFAPALLAALIMVETFGGSGRSLTFDARAAGLAVAGAVLVTTESLIGAVIGAAAATALLRLIA
jgi:branched-subunit amino acid transport protein